MNENGNTPVSEEKTFTQEQVNAIVGERLAKEKVKAEALIAQRESELVRRELMLLAREKLIESGLPAELAEALDLSSPESFEKGFDIVKRTYSKRLGGLTGMKPVEGRGAREETGGGIRQAMGLV